MEENQSDYISVPEAALAGSRTKFTDIMEISHGRYMRLFKAMRNGQWWVLKSLNEEYASVPVFQQMLAKEYAITCHISHPYVVKAYDMEEVPGIGTCIVMEYIEGEPLGDCTDLAVSTRRSLMRQTAEALAYIHKQGIVHRDIKPSNIIVTQGGRYVKIIDFGLSDTYSYSYLKQPAGTPLYIAPEQQNGEQLDVRSDIYSLGIIMKEMNIGMAYLPVTWKMTRLDPDKRHQNMEMVISDFDKIKTIQHYLIIILTALVAIALVGSALYKWKISPDASAIKSLNTEQANMRDSLKNLVLKQISLNEKEEKRIQHEQYIINKHREAKRQLDKVMKNVGFVPEKGKQPEDLLIIVNAVSKFLKTYRDTVKGVTPEEKSELYNDLYQHYADKLDKYKATE